MNNGDDKTNIDDKILAQRDAIEQDIAKSQPLVGSKTSIQSLIDEYDENTSGLFYSKANNLAKTYGHMRRVRGDGNCFYRAVGYSLAEMCLGHPEQASKKINVLENWKNAIENMGYSSVAISDFFDCLILLLREIKDGMDAQSLWQRFNDSYSSNYAVVCLRLITAGYLKQNAAMFEGFIVNGESLDDYCQREVQPMNHECDHVSILALVKALELSVIIEYMDQSETGAHHSFNTDDDKLPKLFFLYRPGHYDILYAV